MTVVECYGRAVADAMCLRCGHIPRWMRDSPRYPIPRARTARAAYHHR